MRPDFNPVTDGDRSYVEELFNLQCEPPDVVPAGSSDALVPVHAPRGDRISWSNGVQ